MTDPRAVADRIIDRLPVDHTTCTVLGNRAKSATDPLWAGLDMSRAEPRVQSTLMLTVAGPEAPTDIHLAVPWCHPSDQTGSPDDFDCIYRVRPKMGAGKRWKRRKVDSVAFERWDGKWWLAVAFAAIRGKSQ